MTQSVRDVYTREMYAKTRLFAAWPPSAPVALGDVGVLDRNVFRKVTTLMKLDVAFTAGPAGYPADVDYSTAEYMSVIASAGAQSGPAGPATGVTISFTRAGAVLFQARHCVVETVEDLPGIEAALRPLRQDKTWRPEYVIVTSLLRTGPTAIVISDERGATMELSADAGALAAAVPVAAALDGGLAVSSRRGVTIDVLSKEGATPLFGVSQLRRKLWGGSALVFRTGEDDELPEVELTSVEWSHDDESDEFDDFDGPDESR